MTCEEFQLATLDLDSLSEMRGELARLGTPSSQAVREHFRECAHCAAFQNSWLDLRSDLHALGAENEAVEAPSRVEMRLRQEFRTKHRTLKTRRKALIAAWALAAAAVVVGTIGWMNWRHEKSVQLAHTRASSPVFSSQPGENSGGVAPAGPELGEVLVAANSSGDFTLLPDSMPGFLGDATVVHVQMQRAALGALGLTVNEEHAGDWIQVDLLLGGDGQPQAVRLPESSD